MHPLRVHTVTSAAPAPPRVYEVAPNAEKSTAFPRRIDRIATEAQGRFVVILSICTLLALVFSIVVQIDKVTRASGRIVTQQTKQEVQHLEGGIIAEILVRAGDTVAAVAACSSSIEFPGQLVGSFDTTLTAQTNTCSQFVLLPGFCSDGSPGPCPDGGYPDAGTTVLVVSTTGPDAGYISYQSGSQSATATGTFDGQTVQTLAAAQRLFVLDTDAGCVALVTETIQLSIYASLDGGCQDGIPAGPPPATVGGVWQTTTSPACGLLVDSVVPDTSGFCCPVRLLDGGCDAAPPPPCTVSFGLTGQGRSSPP